MNKKDHDLVKTKSEFWQKKHLIWDFAVADLKLRYRNSILGFFWTLLEPLLILSVLYIVFTNVFESEIEYFPLYLLLGLIMWNMVVRGTLMAQSSLITRAGIFTSIKIPVSFPPLGSSITSLIMFCFELVVLGMFFIWFNFIPPLTILLLPLILGLEFVLILGLSLPLSVLNVKIKDTQFVWTIILTAGFFLSPIFYKIEILPDKIQSLIKLNPMVGILNAARDVSLYGNLPAMEDLLFSILITAIIFVIGYMIFRKYSTKIVEEL